MTAGPPERIRCFAHFHWGTSMIFYHCTPVPACFPKPYIRRFNLNSMVFMTVQKMMQTGRRQLSVIGIAYLLSLILVSVKVNAASPDLPRSTVDTTMPTLTGATIFVNSGGDLQAAIDAADLGDEIVLEAGANFTGTFTLPDKGAGSDWIIIRSSAVDSMPPGKRATVADASSMPKIVGSGSPVMAFRAEPNAHHYRLIGLEIYPRSGQFTYALNSFEWSNHHIIFDRVYAHGNELGGRRFAALNGQNIAVIDSHISGWWENGADSQAVWWKEGQTHLLHNNFLEAAGEVIMTGGAPYVDSRLPSDITITKNTFTKRLSWWSEDASYDGQSRTIKNILELKAARRVLIEANTFTNFWIEDQRLPIVFKSSNQAPNCANPNAITEHITFRNNLLNGIGNGVQVSNDGVCPNGELDSQNILIENNLLLDINLSRSWHSSLANGTGRPFEILGSHPNVIIRHNTVLNPEGDVDGAILWIEGNNTGLIFENNIVGHARWGVRGSGLGVGNGTLNSAAPGAVYQGNVQYGDQPQNISNNYPPGQFYPTNIAAIDFVNYVESGGGDYRLSDASPFKGAGTDGKDPGVDMDVFEAVQGWSGSRPSSIDDLR